MKVLDFGSLNLDHIYSVPHIVTPGETITSTKLEVSPGGKGLNQAIALARAGMEVYLAGSIGEDGEILMQVCAENGVNTEFVHTVSTRSGNAIIQVNEEGQNSIILFPGANREQKKEYIDEVLEHFHRGDVVVLQNEINMIDYIIEQAYRKEMVIALNPSPFDQAILDCDLKKVTYFLLNEIEGEMITGKTDPKEMLYDMKSKYADSKIVLTLGKKGVKYLDNVEYEFGIYKTEVVDTTAAGDTFTGYFLKYILMGSPVTEALKVASLAASISVSKKGAAVSIPPITEVLAALGKEI